MSKKGLLYIGGGLLLILSTVLSVILDVKTSFGMWADKLPSLSYLIEIGFFKYYMQHMGITQTIQWIIPILIGLVLVAKAFVGDMIPDIVLVGLFGVLALLEGVAFLKSVPLLFRGGDIIEALLSVTMNFLMVLAYGGMAAIIFMKDSFGGFFFVPAAAVGVNALLRLVLYSSVWSYYWSFKVVLLIFLLDMVFAAALFVIGKAVVED